MATPEHIGKRPGIRAFHAVGACFFLSGFAALIYQAAWLKKLGILFGTSHTAVATVLAAYMGGLAVGAAAAARYSPRITRPVFVYGVLEAVIGISAILVPLVLVGAQHLLVALFGNQPAPVSADGASQSLYYLVATFLVLLIPTGAMGATLPLLARYAVTEDLQIGPRVGALYGVNTLGAVLGALAAGLLLLPYPGLYGALFVGAGVNLVVFFIALHLSRSSKPTLADKSYSTEKKFVRPAFHWVMPAMLVSGAVSFTLEVLWTRLLSHVFGGTVYAFSIMLASFLAGISLGGLAGGRLAVDRARALTLFAGAQISIAVFSLMSYSYIDAWVPVHAGLATKAVYAFLVILPSAVFIGATYPLAVRIACPAAIQSAAVSGRIYAWNTVGAIAGSLLTGFVILPALGFGNTLKVALLLSLLLALISALKADKRNHLRTGITVGLLLSVAFLVSPQRPDALIHAYLKKDLEWGEERYYGVGRSATILLREAQGFINLLSNGLSEASIGRKGMPPFNLSQKWLSALPTLARPDAQSMLIVGYGGGVAVEGVPPGIRDIDVVELEPKVIKANESVIEDRGSDPLADPRVSLVLNDARNALLLTSKSYDIIVSQPSHPWTGGASHLYTREFLGLSKRHLNERGVFLQWINSQFVDADLLRVLMATLVEQFAHVELYQPERQVLLFVASDAPIEIWQGAKGAVTALSRYTRHYQRMGLRTLEDAVAMTLLDDRGVRSFAAGAAPNTDDRNRLAFFSRERADGLNAEDLFELFEDVDPLTNSNSEFHQRMADEMNVAYIAEQLLQANFTKRAFMMARAARSPSMSSTIDGLGFYHTDEPENAEAAFANAIVQDPVNGSAQTGLLRMYLGALAQRRLPDHIAKLANRQEGPERRVLEGWVYGSSGDFATLRNLDAELAQVAPTSLTFPIAVKLRVDWRVVYSQSGSEVVLAQEALAILDDLLASHWNLDLYLLRAGAALLAEDSFSFMESLATANRQVKARLEALEAEGGEFPADEGRSLQQRLSGMKAQLPLISEEEAKSRAAEIAIEIDEVLAQL